MLQSEGKNQMNQLATLGSIIENVFCSLQCFLQHYAISFAQTWKQN